MSKPQFFMRFYQMPKKHVEEFCFSLQQGQPKIVDYHVGPLSGSVNAVVVGEAFEATFYFKTEADREEVKSDPRTKMLYQYACKHLQGAKMVERKPGDPCGTNFPSLEIKQPGAPTSKLIKPLPDWAKKGGA